MLDEIIIKDNGEKLVDIEKVCHGLVIDLKPKRKAYFRETIAKMICQAKENLPKGTTFIIGDAWRPKDIQKEVYRDLYNKFRQKYPEWQDKKLKEETDKFIAPFEGPIVSGHMTGGAVDLRLLNKGRKMPMKSKRLTYQENAKSLQPKLPKYIQKNRQIMFEALIKAGLSNYPQEYWHWSYGDYWWAKRNNKNEAIYGPVENFKG